MLTDAQTAVLKRLASAGSSASTFWISHGIPYTSRQINRVCHQLKRSGFVSPHPGRSGNVYWWQATDAGRAAIDIVSEPK